MLIPLTITAPSCFSVSKPKMIATAGQILLVVQIVLCLKVKVGGRDQIIVMIGYKGDMDQI